MTNKELMQEIRDYSEKIRLRKNKFHYIAADEMDGMESECCEAIINKGICSECGEHC